MLLTAGSTETLNDMPETSQIGNISFLSQFHVFQLPLSMFFKIILPFPFLSLSANSCEDHHHRLWSLAAGRQFSFGSGMERDKGSMRWLPLSVFFPVRPQRADCPLFHNSISRDYAAKTVKNPLHHVSSSAMFSLTSTFVSVTRMNMEDEYGPTSEVKPNSTRDRPVNHEMVFTEGVWTNLDWLKALPSLGNFLTFILCSRP